MDINSTLVKELREKTNAGMMDCKAALVAAKGDLKTAVEILRKKGLSIAAKKVSRQAKDGVIGSYVHMAGKIGVLVEVNCETDFVAKNQIFQELVKDIAMQVTASHPRYVRREDVPMEIVAKEKEILASQIKDKPAGVVDKIVQGKLDKFFQETCLLEQPFVKDGNHTIRELLNSKIAQIGENIVIRRFVRFALGEEI